MVGVVPRGDGGCVSAHVLPRHAGMLVLLLLGLQPEEPSGRLVVGSVLYGGAPIGHPRAQRGGIVGAVLLVGAGDLECGSPRPRPGCYHTPCTPGPSDPLDAGVALGRQAAIGHIGHGGAPPVALSTPEAGFPGAEKLSNSGMLAGTAMARPPSIRLLSRAGSCPLHSCDWPE